MCATSFTLLQGDCLEVLNSLEFNPVDAIITDPPYKQEAHSRGFVKSRPSYAKMAKWTNMDNDWYNEEFLDRLVSLCKFPNLFLFCGKRDLLKVLNFAEKRGYHYHIIPMLRTNPPPFTKNTWLTSESAVHVVDRKLLVNTTYADKIPYHLGSGGSVKNRTHPNEKPVEFLRRVIRNICVEGGRILDPFAGTASCGVAAVMENRNYVGIELDEDYVKIGRSRMEDVCVKVEEGADE